MLKAPMARATMHAKTAVSLPCPIISALLWLCSCFKLYTSPNACNLTNKFFGHNYWNHWFKKGSLCLFFSDTGRSRRHAICAPHSTRDPRHPVVSDSRSSKFKERRDHRRPSAEPLQRVLQQPVHGHAIRIRNPEVDFQKIQPGWPQRSERIVEKLYQVWTLAQFSLFTYTGAP